MIKPTQRKLTIIFTTIIIVFNALILCISFMTLNRSLIQSLKNHINNDVKDEYIDAVKAREFARLESLREDEVFQVFDKSGLLVTGTHKYRMFKLPINREMLAKAFSGKQKYETLSYNDNRYLISYIYIDEQYAGRVALQLNALIDYERNFFKLVILMLPVVLLVSYLVSRYLVTQAMKPIADIFTFQENFSSNVTHELRSPLASLKGNLEVTLRKERSVEDYRETLRLGLREVDRIIGMINNLYMLASSKFRPLDLVKKEVNLSVIIADVLETYKTDVAAKNIIVDTSGLTDVLCNCDDTLMRRAIENLLDNAVKYTPDGGLIKVGLSKTDQRLSLTISNTCNGISRDEMKHFFEPFFRGQNALNRSIEGKGLGLYIARYIVRSHGGEITIKDLDDGMCTIEISHEPSSFKFLKLN